MLTSCLSLIADSPRSRLVKYPLMLRSIQKYVSTAMARVGGISGRFPWGISGKGRYLPHLWFRFSCYPPTYLHPWEVVSSGVPCSVPPQNFPLSFDTFTYEQKTFHDKHVRFRVQYSVFHWLLLARGYPLPSNSQWVTPYGSFFVLRNNVISIVFLVSAGLDSAKVEKGIAISTFLWSCLNR